MELTKYSRNHLLGSLDHWGVGRDFAEPMYNYLVHGFEPGGFFAKWYANDATAILHSHPANSVEELKNLTKWMINCMPTEARGSHAAVKNWIGMSAPARRKILEDYGLVYTEQEEIVMALKNQPTSTPIFY